MTWSVYAKRPGLRNDEGSSAFAGAEGLSKAPGGLRARGFGRAELRALLRSPGRFA